MSLEKKHQKEKKLLNANIINEFTSRSTIVKPICDKQITDKYISWLNDDSLNQYLEVRYQKQTEKSV